MTRRKASTHGHVVIVVNDDIGDWYAPVRSALEIERGGLTSTLYLYRNGRAIFYGSRKTTDVWSINPSSAVKPCECCGAFKKESRLRYYYPHILDRVKSKGRYSIGGEWRETRLVCLSCSNKLEAQNRAVSNIKANIRLMEKINETVRQLKSHHDNRPASTVSGRHDGGREERAC